MKKFFEKNKTPIVIALVCLTVMAGAGLLLYYRSHKPATGEKKVSESQIDQSASVLDLTVFDRFIFQEEDIPLTWQDDNNKEDLIITTDKRYYDASQATEVFLSVSNQSEKDQTAEIYFWFDWEDKKVEKAEKVENGKISNNLLISPSTSLKASKLQVPNRKDIKGYTAGSKFEDTIMANQTNYYRAVVKLPKGASGEFFIEAFGQSNSTIDNRQSTIAYGHLDPYYASGLVGYWSFNGADVDDYSNSVYDRSSTYATGTMVNMATSSRATTGISGQALDFDGVNDYVDTNYDYSWTNSDSFTIAGWFKSNDITQQQVIIGKDGDNNSYEYRLYLNSSILMFDYWNAVGATEIYLSNGAELSSNTWYSFAITYNGSTARIYVDGVDLGNDPTVGALINQTDTTQFGYGYFQWDTPKAFSGAIDEVRIYSRALSADEVADLYRVDGARMKINSPASAPFANSGLVGYWSFNGADMDWGSSTAEALDRSGNNNNGDANNLTNANVLPGVSGQALDFLDINPTSNIKVSSSTSLYFNQNVTFACWINRTAEEDSQSDLYTSKDGDQGNGGFLVTIKSDEKLYLQKLNVAVLGSSNSTIPVNEWVFIAVTYANGNYVFYKNGVSDGSGTDLQTFTFGNQIIGAGVGTWSADGFYGAMDEVRIYNRALSASEIQELYRSGAGKMKTNAQITQAGPQGSSLVGNWTFNGQDITGTHSPVGGNIFREGFEGSRYEQSGWSEEVDAGATVNEDSSGPGTLPTGNGSQVLYCDKGGTAWRAAKTINQFSSNQSVVYGRFYFYIDDLSPSPSNGEYIFTLKTSGWTDKLAMKVYDSSGLILQFDDFDESDTKSISYDTWYRVEFKADTSGNSWEWKVNGASEGTGSWSSPPSDFRYVQVGWLNWADASVGKAYFDHYAFDNSNWIGADLGDEMIAVDRSGQGNDGWVMGKAQPDEGVSGQAMSFDGADDFLDVGADSSLDISGAISISAWIYPKNLSGTQVIFVRNQSSSAEWSQYNLVIDSGSQLNFGITDGVNFPYAGGISATTPTVNQWNYVTAVWDGTTGATGMKLYIDGILKDSSQSNITSIWSRDVAAYIGSDAINSRYYFNGLIDEVRVYNRALSQSEITDLYNLGARKAKTRQ